MRGEQVLAAKDGLSNQRTCDAVGDSVHSGSLLGAASFMI